MKLLRRRTLFQSQCNLIVLYLSTRLHLNFVRTALIRSCAILQLELDTEAGGCSGIHTYAIHPGKLKPQHSREIKILIASRHVALNATQGM